MPVPGMPVAAGWAAGGLVAYQYYRFTFTAGGSSTAGIKQIEMRDAVGGSDQLPTMTAATTSGATISASTEQGGFEGWRVGDDTGGNNGWFSTATGYPQTLSIQFASAVIVPQFLLQAPGGGNQSHMVSAGVLHASDTGAYSGEEVEIASFSGETAWGALETRVFSTIFAP